MTPRGHRLPLVARMCRLLCVDINTMSRAEQFSHRLPPLVFLRCIKNEADLKRAVHDFYFGHLIVFALLMPSTFFLSAFSLLRIPTGCLLALSISMWAGLLIFRNVSVGVLVLPVFIAGLILVDLIQFWRLTMPIGPHHADSSIWTCLLGLLLAHLGMMTLFSTRVARVWLRG